MRIFIVFILLIFQDSPDDVTLNFLPGYYYTKDGQRVNGQLKLVRSSFSALNNMRGKIKFKKDEKSKAQKFTPDDISHFVIGKDSFTTVYNLKINSIQGEYKSDFVQVIKSGPVNLYLHRSMSNAGQFVYINNKYVLSKDQKTFFGIWNERNQKKELANFFSDTPILAERILEKDFNGKIEQLVDEYNSFILHKK